MAPFCFTAILCSLVYSLAFLKLTSGAGHSLFNNQTLAIGHTLVSETQVFELGFFRPGKSANLFLGIWYKAIPDTVVWVANRNNPITDSQGVVFAVAGNGSLLISRDGSIIWSANPSTAASRPAVRLLETGNLVVVDEATEEGFYLWQSFDFPTDTWLSGMKMVDDLDAGVSTNLTSWRNWDDPSPGDFFAKIESHAMGEMVMYRGTRKRFRTGKWNGIYFNGMPRFRSTVPATELIFKEERLISIKMPYQSSIIVRATLDVSGSILHYIMNPGKDRWNPVYPFPRDECDEYAYCGPNAICAVEKAQRCDCFKGFSPKFRKEWELQDWSNGCGRVRALNCESGDGFVEVRGVKYPDMLRYWLNTSMSLEQCKAECLKNCSCTAYAHPYISNGGRGCLMWYGDLLDARELPATHVLHKIYIRLPLSELDFNSNLETKKAPTNLILISIATGVIVSSFINGGLLILTRRNKRAILEATNNFSKENMLGVGGFGPVYKQGNLSEGEEVAVKRLSKTSGQGLQEFKNEVVLIAKLQHRNLVRLLGCCIEEEEMMLIYEYLQNKSLDNFVFDQDRRKLLTWPKRFDIIMGIAKGLLYLHHDSRLKIIHRDLKTSNILLDASLNPKISDFGLARTFEEDQCLSRTKRVVGTYGYMAPEYAFHGKFSVKSDIYSLGVVLLEIISGKKIRGFQHNDHHHSLLGHVFLFLQMFVDNCHMKKCVSEYKLIQWKLWQAWMLWKEKRIMEMMDECLMATCVESQVTRCIHVGLLCVQNFAEDRPIMPSVVLMLASDGALLPEPNEPGYYIEGSCSPSRSSKSPCIKSENGTLTFTDLEAR
ncbi:G-type lectin S-receptor-like serine/threonine-protein kinase At4g27290 isoform X3 [Salvia miltiorrhiza]|uniref:G-type lectin S-receptor-like serine/threonine-protein kinase At4g27290 isoform X3 n=1 Tax=Salvia miltiorrhiza TaxID=226208 RepID=UPI0025ACF9C5|nr:G-type lectin S-receptor-like serine/threonine-protein kinase At4g27290 isoform X3 [Salvia miltiorrhiza]